MAHAKRPAGRLPHGGKGFRDEGIQAGALFEALAKKRGLGAQVTGTQGRHGPGMCVYRIDHLAQAPQLALIF